MGFRNALRAGFLSIVRGSGGSPDDASGSEGEPPAREPAHEPVRPRRHAPSGRIPKLPSARILIIDDDAHVAQALKRLLRHHHVEIALDGASALTRLRAAAFDVVLSDVMMPAPSGIDVYRTLAEDRPAMLRRFIFITGGGHDLASRQFLRAITNPCLDKPADPVELVRAIGDVLREDAQSSGIG